MSIRSTGASQGGGPPISYLSLDSIRYLLALVVVASFPGMLVLWLVFHGFLPTWRRLGPVRTYVTLASVMAGVAASIYSARSIVLAIDFGANRWTSFAAIPCYGIAVWIEFRCRKHLGLTTLIGLPELSPTPANQRLLQTGIYAHIRHPRYLGLMVGVLAVALFTNYLASYLLAVVSYAGFLWITELEERELVKRFGTAYRDYQEHVPRFLPRLGGR